jgi:hypothetical protein
MTDEQIQYLRHKYDFPAWEERGVNTLLLDACDVINRLLDEIEELRSEIFLKES